MANLRFQIHNQRVYPVKWSECLSDGEEIAIRPRGRVGSFSKYSAKRLSSIFYSFKELPFRTFWTLTYNFNQAPLLAKKDLHRFCVLLNRRNIGWLWCMEFQKSGRVHFHIAMTKFLSKPWVAKKWGHGFVHVGKVFGTSALRKYFLKEVAKNNQKSFHGFNGRWWGVSRRLNRKFLTHRYDESFLLAMVGELGYKTAYWSDECQNILDMEN